MDIEVSKIENYFQTNTGSATEKKQKSMETDKHKKVLMKIDETNNLNRNETFTKSDRKRVTEKISKSNPRTEAGKTNFREVADRKRRTEDPVLSVPSSPLSWYIPSQSNSRSGSNNSELIEDSRHQASQANIRARASSVSNQQSFGWNGLDKTPSRF